MIRYTQSNTAPGNCYQTAIACLLDVDPAALPDQVSIEAAHETGYGNAINKYLRKHHNKHVQWLHYPSFHGVMPREPGYHLIAGPTVRTPESGVQHIVVGLRGEMVWDPHPSRAGLTSETAWVVFVPAPPEWEESWEDMPCACPSCGGAP